jgi:hypothetical protein
MFVRPIVFTLAVLFGATAAEAASPIDVAKVAAMVTDASVPVLLRQKEYVNGEYLGDTIVFVQGGHRYTIYNAPKIVGRGYTVPGMLSVWVRKNGTAGQRMVDGFTDQDFDGSVNFGLDGADRKLFEGGMDSYDGPKGLAFRSYWQRQYDAAIHAALAYRRSVRK